MPLASLHAVPAALRGAIETISEWQRQKGERNCREKQMAAQHSKFPLMILYV